MNRYMIYNSGELTIINKANMNDAKQWAVMYCDHSHEIIVREVNNIKSYA